jgi:membrane-associated phospholipid phosphatase
MSATVEAPTFRPTGTRWRLDDVVPFEEWRIVRICMMSAYVGIYLWWLRERGLPIDRISVAISVGLFLLCAFVGRTWRTWGILLLDALAYCVMWVLYERTRGWADSGFHLTVLGHEFSLRFPLQVDLVRNMDRLMFFGHDPNVILQHHFWERSVRWYDVVASAVYMTHFVVPMIAMAVLWVLSHRQWVRFMKRFASLLFLACILFVLMPTAPPWMAADTFKILPHLDRNAWRGFYHIGFRGFTNDYKVALTNGNSVAAMPSLHASFALVVPLFFMQWISRRWIRWSLLLFPLTMLTSLVYLGEHWVADGLVGWCITVGVFVFWDWREQKTRDRRADHAVTAAMQLEGEPA